MRVSDADNSPEIKDANRFAAWLLCACCCCFAQMCVSEYIEVWSVRTLPSSRFVVVSLINLVVSHRFDTISAKASPRMRSASPPATRTAPTTKQPTPPGRSVSPSHGSGSGGATPIGSGVPLAVQVSSSSSFDIVTVPVIHSPDRTGATSSGTRSTRVNSVNAVRSFTETGSFGFTVCRNIS